MIRTTQQIVIELYSSDVVELLTKTGYINEPSPDDTVEITSGFTSDPDDFTLTVKITSEK